MIISISLGGDCGGLGTTRSALGNTYDWGWAVAVEGEPGGEGVAILSFPSKTPPLPSYSSRLPGLKNTKAIPTQ